MPVNPSGSQGKGSGSNKKQSTPRRPRTRITPSAPLTEQQISIAVATLLGDGWIEQRPKEVRPRIGLQLKAESLDLITYWIEVMDEYIGRKEPDVKKANKGSYSQKDQWQKRTGAHDEFHQFRIAFGGVGRAKTIPKVSYLVETLTAEGLAFLIMLDGSVKSKESKGMEIHTQGFKGFEPTARLAVALYKKFGIKASVTRSDTEQGTGARQYHLYISGHSLPIIRKEILPHMLPAYTYKIPTPHVLPLRNHSQLSWEKFYDFVKDKPYLEDLTAKEDNPELGVTRSGED